VCTFGILGGIAYAFQSTANRFCGLAPNEAEVLKYGALTEAQVKRVYHKMSIPNAELIDSINPVDEPLPHPTKRYGKFSPEDVRNYREKSKINPHLFDPLAPVVDNTEKSK
jgi:hypothetical protein